MQNKILLAAPHSSVKNYCFPQWVTLAKSFGVDIFIADNSENDANKDLYKAYGIEYIWIDPAGKTSRDFITRCQNVIRTITLTRGCTHLFMLETDLFPSKQILPLLETLNLPVVSAPYFLFKGSHAAPMNQEVKLVGGMAYTRNYTLRESFHYTDGGAHQCFSVGFGCTLIKREVLEKIAFRCTGDEFVIDANGSQSHADSYFYGDLQRLRIPAYLYTGTTVRHYNSDWSKYKFKK